MQLIDFRESNPYSTFEASPSDQAAMTRTFCEKISMRPASIFALVVCVELSLSAFIISVCSDLEFLSLNLWWSLFKNVGSIAAMTFAVIYWLESRPKIFKFVEDHWKTDKGTPRWNELTITILEKTHKRGKNPTVSFLGWDSFTRSESRLVYRINENGDIIICHDENSFMPPWEEFAVKVSK